MVINDAPVSHVYPASRRRPIRPPGNPALLEHGDLAAGRLQPQRQGEAAQARADHPRRASVP